MKVGNSENDVANVCRSRQHSGAATAGGIPALSKRNK